jgi:hypothetical protein
MTDLKSRISDPKSRIVLLAGGIILLGLVAWGIGWGARALLDRPAAQPPTPTMTARVEPTPFPTATATATAQVPITPSPIPPTNTPPSTFTPVPAPTTAPTGPVDEGAEAWEVVQPGDGLYMVCRRHCSTRWPPDDADLEEYAREVAQLNGLLWPNPALSPGQELRMPRCP